jgi:hypothetical protein
MKRTKFVSSLYHMVRHGVYFVYSIGFNHCHRRRWQICWNDVIAAVNLNFPAFLPRAARQLHARVIR